MFDVTMDQNNYIGMAGVQNFDQQPEYVPWLLAAVVAMLRAGWANNIQAVATALQQFPELAEQLQRILELPRRTVDTNLSNLPTVEQERAERMISAANEGIFDLDPIPGPQSGDRSAST
jgi:hypothetical protein